ncbi:uncharacterized protein BP5553_02820 [Venustampulla echinocandica]|uniref:Uncharacterized protein n=1 Tax=Venustampulla echinocandica TaxID=2656787 RepID=A0A370TSH1_9HELO|nr:uncharacterized protein BP5553_02820 [Venustampulla echinocandica]RDL38480.1 hypothetical protein BP5553_02820 [Venustampulla echinocandica]
MLVAHVIWNCWEDFIAAQEKEEYPVESIQLSALRKLFSDPTVPISQVALELATPILKELEKNPGKTVDCFRLWRTIEAAIKQLTDYNDKLVELVIEFQKVPDQAGIIGCMQDFREHWTEFAFDYLDLPSWEPAEERAANRQGWINMNAFGAKLSLCGAPELDERPRAALLMRQALEKTPWEVFHHPDLDEEEDLEDDDYPTWRAHQFELRDVRTLNSSVPAAAMWMKINASGIYEMNGRPMTGDYDCHRADSNWKGEPVWSKERFAFWRERFEWISNVSVLDKETKKAAKEAAEAMKKVEDENQRTPS